jgi:hypothetical protein
LEKDCNLNNTDWHARKGDRRGVVRIQPAVKDSHTGREANGMIVTSRCRDWIHERERYENIDAFLVILRYYFAGEIQRPKAGDFSDVGFGIMPASTSP